LKHFLVFSNDARPETVWFLSALKILEAFFAIAEPKS